MEIGGEILKFNQTEKLLGLNISSNLDWDTHVDLLCISLKQRMGLLARAKDKVTKEKLQIISEAIFMSKVRYGLAVYTKPKYEFNHLKQHMDPNVARLQVIQNDLLRMMQGHSGKSHTNM